MTRTTASAGRGIAARDQVVWVYARKCACIAVCKGRCMSAVANKLIDSLKY